MEREFELADFVLVICTDRYREQFEGNANAGLGILWEGSLIANALYQNRGENKKFVPVVFDDTGSTIPLILRAHTFYRLPEAYEQLYRLLTDQPLVVRPQLGPRQALAPVRSVGAFVVGTEGAHDTLTAKAGQPSRNLAHLLELQDAWRRDRLSVIAGAGVGVVAGMPTWSDLLQTLLSAFVKKAYAFSDDAETDAMIAGLQQRLRSQSPLIYAQFVRSQFNEQEFIDLLHLVLYPTEKPIARSPICTAIARLGHHLNCVLTFNYDSLIEDALSSEGFANTPVFEASGWSSVDGLAVYHPHGYLPRRRLSGKAYRVILAESDYHTQ